MSDSCNIRIYDANTAEFDEQLQQLTAWDDISDAAVVATVSDILQQIRQRGDDALMAYSNQFDHTAFNVAADFCLNEAQLFDIAATVPEEQRKAIADAAARIRDYHQRQRQESWQYRDEHGNLLGQQITAIAKAGIYVPGGKASYPSSVLMNAIPAQVAGVEEIVMVTPTPNGEFNPMVMAAACEAGVKKVYTVGGAQAVAALAYGTQSVPRVDKIVGPGNIFVATAKRMLYGTVGLDMVAGPSEILVVADGSVDPEWIAMDLFSQAEHDEKAQAILIATQAEYIQQVQQKIDMLLPTMERREIIEKSLTDRGAFILVDNLEQAMDVVNKIAPEHLELAIDNAEHWVDKVRHAGAIFVGSHTPEAFGDYSAGPNHVLPTSTTARFSSPLGVYDFQKRSSIIGCSKEGAQQVGAIASVMARGESLTAHARSAEYRLTNADSSQSS